ncbi:MAG: gliding motility-associated C-terminal domain-containing protein [Saprospiraceae bacterium]|nr:gliding motility-associated C-terminal domain-containing protein [Saprospiraceae bacterium]
MYGDRCNHRQCLCSTNCKTNPSAFQSGNTTVYATVTSNGCTSAPSQVTLQVLPNSPSSYGMDIVQSTICDMGLMTIQFTVPTPGVYTYTYNLFCNGNNSPNTFTTSANPIFLAVTESCTLEITNISSAATGCSVTFTPPLTDNIVVLDPPNITVTAAEICGGGSLDLANYVSSDPGATITFHSANPPNTGNQLPSSIVSPSSTTTYYILSSIQGCSEQASLTVQVQAGGPTFTLTETVCMFDDPINLNTLITPAGITGTWTGTGVSGNFFDPENLSGNVLVTFTPTSICYEEGTVSFQIVPGQQPVLSTATICESDNSFDLNTLEDPSVPNGTWSGPAVSGEFFIPTGLSGAQTVTFQGTGQCVQVATTTINVNAGPNLQVSTPVSVCSGASTDLVDYVSNPQNLALTFYSGLPLTPQNQLSSSIIQVAQSSSYIVKITDSNGCFSTAEIAISALPSGTPNLSTAQVCQTQGLFDLTSLEDAAAGPGSWQGIGVVNNLLNVANQSGFLTLTFTPVNNCFVQAVTTVEVVTPAIPTLGSLSACSGDGLINLATLEDPLYPDGYWAGPGVNGTSFDPTNLSGTVSLTFTPTSFCVNPSTTFINVIETQFPEVSDTSICIDVPFLDLSLLNDPVFTSGDWSGQGVTNNEFSHSGVSGNYVVVFVSDELCVAPASANISITDFQQAVITDFSVCASLTPINLNDYGDPDFPDGTWNGQGVTGNIFQAGDLQGILALTFSPASYCSVPSTANLTILNVPAIDGLQVVCQPDNKTYKVLFEMNGGAPNTYLVNGIPSNQQFESSLIQSGDSYSFSITDGNNCGTTTVNGTKNCDCITDAGTANIKTKPVYLCTTQIASADHNNNQILDGNDKFFFILHDKEAPVFGSIISASQNGSFSFQSNMKTDSIYYITAICGDSLPNGFVDLQESCFSYTGSQKIIFYKAGYSLSGLSSICAQDCQTITLNFQGIPPFIFSYNVNHENVALMNDTLQTLEPKASIVICPEQFNLKQGAGMLQTIHMRDANCKVTIPDSMISWVVNPPRIKTINEGICIGETFEVNGKIYSSNRLTGVDTIRANVAGQCDSIIYVNLNEITPSTYQLNRSICENESLEIHGEIFNKSNPFGEVILPKASRLGCDSIIQVRLTIENEKNTQIQKTLCPGEFILVNGIRYDATKPSGVERIVGVEGGCDSVITVNIQFFQPPNFSIADTLCPGESRLVGSEIFNQQKPSGTVVLKNANVNGCDSIVSISLVYKNVRVDSVFITMYKGQDTVILNTLFSESNRQGLLLNGKDVITGCDQLVFVRITFVQEEMLPVFTVQNESCPDENDGYVVVNSITGCRNFTAVCGKIKTTLSAFPARIGPLPPGKYSLEIFGDEGCSFVKELEIASGTLATNVDGNALFQAIYNEPVSLLLNWTGTPTNINWTPPTYLSCADCPQPIFTGTESQEYVVTYSDSNGCSGSSLISVQVSEQSDDIFVPNIISLSSTGENAAFTAYAKGNAVIKSLTLFDRWGNRLFENKADTPTKTIGWNGLMGSRQVNPGVYVFFLEALVDGKNVVRSGDITVIR